MRTREILLTTANELLQQGSRISVAQVAQMAGVSKTTAYRYFSGAEALVRESSLHLKAQSPDDLFDQVEDDLTIRINRLIDYHFDLLTQNENEFRLFLSSAIQDSVVNREGYSRAGRRILLIEQALRPLKKGTDINTFRKMVNSISVVLGIESLTVLKDLSQLSDQEVVDTWRWLIFRIVGLEKN